MDCYNSSDPAAVNSTLMYDFNSDEVNLWKRTNVSVPLPACSSSPPPDISPCLVCVKDQIHYAVCKGLKDTVKMMWEAAPDEMKYSKSECPQLLSPAASNDHQTHIITFSILAFLLLLLFLFIGGMLYLKKRRNNKAQKLNGGNIVEDEESSSLNDIENQN